MRTARISAIVLALAAGAIAAELGALHADVLSKDAVSKQTLAQQTLANKTLAQSKLRLHFPRPDLTVTSVTCTKTNVTVIVKNIGAAGSAKICRLRVAVYSGEYQGGKHEFTRYMWFAPLKAGDTRIVSISNPKTLPSGVIWLFPYIDDTNLIAEQKETNNVYYGAKVLP